MNQEEANQSHVPALISELSDLDKILSKLPSLVQTKLQLAEVFESIHRKMNLGLEGEHILEAVFNALDPIIPFIRIGIALLENDNQDIKLYWVKSKLPIKGLKKGYTAKLEDSSLKKIFETGEPRIINDLKSYLRLHPGSKSTEMAIQDGIMSSLTCPLVIKNKRLGFIFFSSVNSYTYERVHQEMYKEIASGLSLIVEQELIKKKH
jgi:transcriptional regulator with GAF, ATPase, and Fis domain